MSGAAIGIVVLIGLGVLLLTQFNFSLLTGPSTLARAIGVAEGGYDASGNNLNNGSRPSRNKNPGDVTADLVGKAVGQDGPFPIYQSDADGWANTQAQVNLALSGSSVAGYSPDMSIAEMASIWTATNPQQWAATVAQIAGADVNTPIGAV